MVPSESSHVATETFGSSAQEEKQPERLGAILEATQSDLQTTLSRLEAVVAKVTGVTDPPETEKDVHVGTLGLAMNARTLSQRISNVLSALEDMM